MMFLDKSPSLLPNRLSLYMTALLYILLAILYLRDAEEGVMYAMGAACILSSIWLMTFEFASAVSLIVLVTHIGPVLRVTVPVLGMITIGDLYLALVTVVFLIRLQSRPFNSGPFGQLIPVFILLQTLNILFTPSLAIALPGLINLAQIALVYFIVLSEIKTERQVNDLFVGIGVAVLVSATMHLYFYSQGKTLGLTAEEDWFQSAAIMGEGSYQFVKTSFFYVSFLASCVVAIILGLRRIFIAEKTNVWSIGFWLVVTIAAASYSIVVGSRTNLLSAIVIAVVLQIVVIASALFGKTKVGTSRSVRVAGLGIVIASAIGVFENVVSDRQQEAFAESMIEDAAISFEERTSMWSEIPGKIARFPMEFLIGVGPDVPARGGDLPVVAQLMYIDSLNFQPPSFHNFYIDMIFQQGIFAFMLIMFVVISTLRSLVRALKKDRNLIATDCLLTILGWLILWITHATGWSKPVLILAELFAVAHLASAQRVVWKESAPRRDEVSFGVKAVPAIAVGGSRS